MSDYEYRIEMRAPEWGDGSWDADEITVRLADESRAREVVAAMLAEDAKDGESFDYRIMRRNVAWEEVYYVARPATASAAEGKQ